MTGASFADILDGYEFTDFDGNIGQHRAYVHRELGTVYCVSDDLDLEAVADAVVAARPELEGTGRETRG